MNGYKNFLEDVKNSFKEIIEKYNPQITFSGEGNDIYAVQLNFQKSTIILDLDRLDLQAKFLNPINQNEEYYHIYDVLYVLHPKINLESGADDLSNDDQRTYIKRSLTNLARQIRKYLLNVVEGDFCWVDEYRLMKDHESWLLKKLWALNYNDPIYQKFKKGDMSWKQDLIEKYGN